MTGVGRARASASPPPPLVPSPPPPRLPLPSSSLPRPIAPLPSPPRPPPAIPEVPSAHKLRHSARSRRIHLRLPAHPLEKPGSSALHYGYCDFAQYDGRWQGKGVRVPAAAPRPIAPAAPSHRPIAPAAPSPARYSRSALCAQTSSFCAQSQNPSPPASAPPREARVLCTPLWMLRLRAA